MIVVKRLHNPVHSTMMIECMTEENRPWILVTYIGTSIQYVPVGQHMVRAHGIQIINYIVHVQ